MADPRFFDNRGPFALSALAEAAGARIAGGADPAFLIQDVADARSAVPGELCLAGTARFLASVGAGAIAVLVPPSLEGAAVERGLLPLVHDAPTLAFAVVAQTFYAGAGRDAGPTGLDRVDATARLGKDVVVEAGAVIGPHAQIGDGSRIGANAVIGRGVCVGRDCYVGPGVSIICALIGDRVTIHGGTRIGTDGFGYASGPWGHKAVPQIGRVIIQDDVDIGANCCVDRGALGDTTIGEGTKIDNLVQIGHNNVIGRRAILVSQVGISGSVTIGDWAILGGKVGVADHVSIGAGARVAAKAGVSRDLAAGQDYAGFPAQPAGSWRREVALLRRMVKGHKQRDE